MDSVPNSETKPAETQAEATPPGEVPVTETRWFRLRSSGASLGRYLLDSEVHTYAFSVAANAILSFIPFIVLLYSLASKVFHSEGMVKTVTAMVEYFVPSDPDFVATVLQKAAAHQEMEAFSIVMILVACTGIFLPLEVALNQAWGVTKSRNYLMNQLVAFGLAILMVVLGMASVVVNAAFSETLKAMFFGHVNNAVYENVYPTLTFAVLTATTGVAAILFFFSIYWLLPNRKVPWQPIVRTSIITGVIWLLSKYAFLALLPHFHLKDLYGGFHVSVGIIFWAYTSGLILFAGAQFSVKRGENTPQ